MSNKIRIDKIIELFESHSEITNSDILLMYKKDEPNIPESTVNWRIYHLVQNGVIQRIGRGRYKIGNNNQYKLQETKNLTKLSKLISSQLPYINYCVWELSEINKFLQHLINFDIIFLDIERIGIDSAYFALKENKNKVFRIRDIIDDLSEYSGYICIRPLVTESPINHDKIKTAKLEKILVDLYCDKEFISFQGNEIFHIFNNAFNSYTINESTLLRYANRKEKKEEISQLINSIKRQ
ncbi:DUF6577 family protein [Parabacteroides chinchillae]